MIDLTDFTYFLLSINVNSTKLEKIQKGILWSLPDMPLSSNPSSEVTWVSPWDDNSIHTCV